jgi:hypothetical protein
MHGSPSDSVSFCVGAIRRKTKLASYSTNVNARRSHIRVQSAFKFEFTDFAPSVHAYATVIT